MKLAPLALAVLALGAALPAAADDLTPRYHRAADYLPWRVHSWLTQHEAHAAQWSADGSEFRYRVRGPDGVREVVGDARTGSLKPAAARALSPAQPVTLSPKGDLGVGLEGFNLTLVETASGA